MKPQKPKLTTRAAVLLCALGVALCAAAPAVFLRGADALYLGHPQTVAVPYAAPVPSGDDYYILRQLQTRQQDQSTATVRDAAQSTSPDREPEPPELTGPKLYIGADSSLREMKSYAGYKTTVADAMQSLVDCGALPQVWADAALNWADTESDEYNDYSGYYWLDTVYYSFDSAGIVTFRRYAIYAGELRTAFSLVMDSRTGQVISVWISTTESDQPSMPEATTENLQAFLAQAGLASLGDWTARPDLTYTQALYSTNGQALVAADCKNYAIADVTMPYFSLGITLCAEENLPRRMT